VFPYGIVGSIPTFGIISIKVPFVGE
jgi:hypothetical protein